MIYTAIILATLIALFYFLRYLARRKAYQRLLADKVVAEVNIRDHHGNVVGVERREV